MVRKTPHLILWFLGALLAVTYCSYFLFDIDEASLDINIYDTYYVIGYSSLFLSFAIWLLMCGFGYFILNKYKIKLIYSLTITHLILTLVWVVGVTINYFINGFEDVIIWLSILVFPIAQILYFVNIMLSTLIKVKVTNEQ
ncbi:hypothetical protein H0I23_12130 [Cellulophaga sp. HaHaR_3_176]|uniref:hypothetical protein n=1 Tax=Cellulophaga sp. HaHaR_3_176 TaxID=1942464 RepID=UPI001C200ADB|nr:hypothetical protein [Cellulophaga sp. HaHaR_3_176]QWX83196.1 hypothetical protein H0I23_12130 [Cellulophaga sp. HaHaR_3_176]